ncbi:MAG: 2-C-methyl-D-erythritol 2,4-cyclodiphosphate synthase [Longimicrobiales bacterium]|nr:2-C-methyl-D-erythritol 2,4-cyclodiphosphate synthase [Longimicrobiales bacterium]
MRVGLGYDSHRFDADTPLVLGGVAIPDHPGLTGHSDGDAVCHAVIDAILGAASLGDVGSHFPPTDEQWRGADSLALLRRAVEVLEGENYQVVNVDVAVVCQSPRIGPVAGAMRERLGEALKVGPDFVSVKGKTNEQMGWIGRGEGLAVHAVALIDRLPGGDRPAVGR